MSQASLNPGNRDVSVKTHGGSGRSNGIRLAGILFLLLVTGTIIIAGLMILKWMNDTSRMPLSRLVVTGKTHYTTHDDLRRAIMSLGSPGTFMSQDVNVLQQQIERLPWIQQVSVRKQWPDELKIHLVEYVPVARWNGVHMINAKGKSFSIPASHIGKQALPMLYGPEGSEQDVLDNYGEMSRKLAMASFRLKMVVMTARRSWQLVTENDIRIELGRQDDMKRLQRFIELFPALQPQAIAENKRISYVDLRYDSGAAVGWAPAQTVPQNGNQQQNQSQVKHQ